MFSSTNIGCLGQSEWELYSVTESSKLGAKERFALKKALRKVQKKLNEAEERADELQRKMDEVEGRKTEGLTNQQQNVAAKQIGMHYEAGQYDYMFFKQQCQ